MSKILILAVSGALGTISRYFLAGAVHQMAGASFPYGTLAVNLLGCFMVGFLAAISENKFLLNPQARLFLMIGFCGAFTTFSTFIFETANLIKEGETLQAFWNVVLSVVLGFVVFRLGVLLGDAL